MRRSLRCATHADEAEAILDACADGQGTLMTAGNVIKYLTRMRRHSKRTSRWS